MHSRDKASGNVALPIMQKLDTLLMQANQSIGEECSFFWAVRITHSNSAVLAPEKLSISVFDSRDPDSIFGLWLAGKFAARSSVLMGLWQDCCRKRQRR